MDYRNPLFSIIVFLSLIVITILVVNFLGILKERRKIKHLNEFIDKFDFLDDKEIKGLFEENVSTNALLLLAIAFEKEGNYEKSLNIYLVLLENLETNEKFTILQKMAEVYYKAGFLHKSRESLLEILQSYPRKIDALKLLFVVDDKLKNYDEMDNIIEILEELEENVYKEKAYLLFYQALFSHDKIKIEDIYKKYPILKRNYVSYFLQINPDKVFDILTKKDVYEMIDIFWHYENLPLDNLVFSDLLEAKHIKKIENKSDVFELEVLKYLPKKLADLEFEYICKNCKHLFPFYEDRCPNCKELFSFEVEINISQKTF